MDLELAKQDSERDDESRLTAKGIELIGDYRNVMQEVRNELRRLHGEIEEAATALEQSNSAGNLQKIKELSDDLEALKAQRTTTLEDAQFASDLIVGSLANLGGDAAIVAQKLNVLSNATFKVWSAVEKYTAQSVFVPLAVISALTDLFGLFGGGPSIDEVILEQVQELRRDVAELRREMHFEFAVLNNNLFAVGDKLLDRLDSLERELTFHLDAMEESNRNQESQINQLENRIAAQHMQILERFSESIELELKQEIDLYVVRSKSLKDLSEDSPAAARAEFDRFLSTFFTFATRHASSETMAGGNARVPEAYGSSRPQLSDDHIGKLVTMLEYPDSGWNIINDLMGLAQSSGANVFPNRDDYADARSVLPPLENVGQPTLIQLAISYYPVVRRVSSKLENVISGAVRASFIRDGFKSRREPVSSAATETPDSRDTSLSLPTEPSRLVNPIIWQLASERFLDMANRSPKLFRSNKEWTRRLAEIYVKGEYVLDACRAVTHDVKGDSVGVPHGYVFQRLLDAQIAAIDDFEVELKRDASRVAQHLDASPWNPIVTSQALPDEIVFRPNDDLKRGNPHARGEWGSFPELKLSVEGSRKFEKEIPDPVRLAVQMGLGVLSVEVDEFFMTDRFDQEIDLYGKNHFGKIFVTIQVAFLPKSQTAGRLIIARRQVKANEVLNYARSGIAWQVYNPNDQQHQGKPLRYLTIAQPFDSLTAEEKKLFPNRSNAWKNYYPVQRQHVEQLVWHTGLVTFVDELKKNWDPLMKDRVFDGYLEMVSQEERSKAIRQINQAATSRLISAAMDVEVSARGEIAEGRGRLGNAVRRLYGTQLAMHRFAELALPDVLEIDPGLSDQLIGPQAILSWTKLSEAVSAELPVINPKVPEATDFKARGLIEFDSQSNALRVPIAAEMRIRSQQLVSRLERAICLQTQMGRPHHTTIEAELRNIVATATRMGVNLKDVLRNDMGVAPKADWVVNSFDPNEVVATVLYAH